MIGGEGTIDDLRRRIAELEQERDALAAHVERMKHEWEERDRAASEHEKLELIVGLLYGEPCASLAKRDLLKQAEVLEDHAGLITGEHEEGGLLQSAQALRQQANQLEKPQ